MAVIVGTDFNDVLLGLPTDDTYLGNPGDDLIYGGAGNDSLDGGYSSDFLLGEQGSDTLTGGPGIDVFVFSSATTNAGDVDTVTDMVIGESLLIDIASLDGLVLAGDDATTLSMGQIMVTTSVAGITRLYVGTDSIPGADLTIDLVGSFIASDFWSNPLTNRITFDPAYYIPIHWMGTENGDSFVGNGGNDTIEGMGGNDYLFGGAGDDLLIGGGGSDYLQNTQGADTLTGGAGIDRFVSRHNGNEVGPVQVDLITDLEAGETIEYSGVIFGEVFLNGDDASGLRFGEVMVGAQGAGITRVYVGTDLTPGADEMVDLVGSFSAGDFYPILFGSLVYDPNFNVPLNVLGTASADLLEGRNANDTIQGFDGNDVLSGGRGNDLLDGGAGRDSFSGGFGADTLLGGSGLDTIVGDAGNDYIDGGSEIDRIDGGAGSDTLTGGLGSDVFIFTGYADSSVSNDVDRIADLDYGESLLFTGARLSAVILQGNDPSGLIQGEVMVAAPQAGVTRVYVGQTIKIDLIGTFAATDFSLDANGQSLIYDRTSDQAVTVVGTAGSDSLYGGSQSDSLFGGAAADTLLGGRADDTLDGGAGDDFLKGGTGNDTYVVDSELDVIYEDFGEGVDSVSASSSYMLSANVENLTLTGVADLAGIGNELNNALTGNTGDNWLEGGAGNDTLDGGTGADLMAGGAGNDAYVVDNLDDFIFDESGNADSVYIKVNGYNVPSGIESVTYAPGVERLPYFIVGLNSGAHWGLLQQSQVLQYSFATSPTGGETGFALYSEAQKVAVRSALAQYAAVADVVFVEAPDSANVELRFFRDDLSSGGAFGAAGYSYFPDGGDVHVNVDMPDLSIGSFGYQVLLHEIGHALGMKHPHEAPVIPVLQDTQANTVMTYNYAVENAVALGMFDIATVQYFFGVDSLARAGNDRYGFADRYVWDGAGVDVFDASEQRTGLVIHLEPGTWSYAGFRQDNLFVNGQAYIGLDSYIENAIGGSGSDLLVGNALDNTLGGGLGNDTLDGGAGVDQLIGGVGNDVYLVDSVTDVVVEIANGGTDQVIASVSYVLPDGLEILALAGSAIGGTGNGQNNTLDGNALDNVLDGGDGNDLISGGEGNDTLLGGTGNDTLKGGNHNDLLFGGEGNDLLTGDSGFYTYSNDTLDGGVGADRMLGGFGDDLYIVDNTLDVIAELNAQGTDTIHSSVTYAIGNYIEHLTLTGVAAINATGNGLANILTGNDANNSLNGSAGDDTLIGGLGNDTLNAGSGFDLMQGGQGNDFYVLSNIAQTVTELLGEGTDTVTTNLSYTLGANLENLALTGVTIQNGSGNELANQITGNAAANAINGQDGNDTLLGGTGNDTLNGGNGNDSINGGADNDLLNGGTGNDTMIGGLGDDIFIVDSTGDLVADGVGQGLDEVRSSVSTTLTNNVEKLQLTGTAGLSGTGNGSDNTLLGTSGANALSGLAGNDTISAAAGNDTLRGGAGNDSLTGGPGNDQFVFDTALNAATNVDLITDFTSGADKIGLGSLIFTGINAGTLTTADFFTLGTTAADANDRIVYDQTTGNLFYDADGTGATAAVQFATLGATTHPTVAFTDFLMV